MPGDCTTFTVMYLNSVKANCALIRRRRSHMHAEDRGGAAKIPAIISTQSILVAYIRTRLSATRGFGLPRNEELGIKNEE